MCVWGVSGVSPLPEAADHLDVRGRLVEKRRKWISKNMTCPAVQNNIFIFCSYAIKLIEFNRKNNFIFIPFCYYHVVKAKVIRCLKRVRISVQGE